jgi:hypothetical protein
MRRGINLFSSASISFVVVKPSLRAVNSSLSSFVSEIDC